MINDDHCWIEYTAPRSMLTAHAGDVIGMFQAHRRSAAEILADGEEKTAFEERLHRYAGSRQKLSRLMLSLEGLHPEVTRRRIRTLQELNPEDPWVKRLAETYNLD